MMQQIDSTLHIYKPTQIEEFNCSICREGYDAKKINVIHASENDIAGRTHPFHAECIRPWFNEHNNCPLCRKEITDVTKFYSQLDYKGKDLVEKVSRALRLTAGETANSGVALLDGAGQWFELVDEVANKIPHIKKEFVVAGLALLVMSQLSNFGVENSSDSNMYQNVMNVTVLTSLTHLILKTLHKKVFSFFRNNVSNHTSDHNEAILEGTKITGGALAVLVTAMGTLDLSLLVKKYIEAYSFHSSQSESNNNDLQTALVLESVGLGLVTFSILSNAAVAKLGAEVPKLIEVHRQDQQEQPKVERNLEPIKNKIHDLIRSAMWTLTRQPSFN